MAIVYQHKTLDTNEIFYIGMGKHKKRAFEIKTRSKFHKSVVKKHGVIVEILFEGVSVEEAKLIEIDLIKKYGRRDLGTGILVNQTDGGDGAVNMSEATKKLISKKSKGHKVSEKHKEVLSKAMKGNKHLLGHKHSEETKQKMRDASAKLDKSIYKNSERNKKISESKKGVPRSEETKKKMSDNLKGKTMIDRFGEERAAEIQSRVIKGNTGKKRTEEFKKQQSERFSGENNPMYGKKRTEEFKQTKREAFLKNNPGKNKSEETKTKIRLALKKINGTKVICPHCGKEGGATAMKRWHFDNCRDKQ